MDQQLFQGKFIQVQSKDGWEYVTRGPIKVVAILATFQKQLILVEQFRKPVGQNVVELPAGLCGDKGEESPQVVAERELLEETGYACGNIQSFPGPLPSSAGLTNETTLLFIATNLTKTAVGGGLAEEGENIKVHLVPIEDLWKWIAAKQREDVLVDSKVLAAKAILTEFPHYLT